MSEATVRMPLPEAEKHAAEVVGLLADVCLELTIAGSIRRRAPDVGDPEIVCVPNVEEVHSGLFGDEITYTDLLDARVSELIDAGTFAPRLDKNGRRALGSRYRRLLYGDTPLDLFSPRPESFGAILAIRTGPAAYSHQLVTSRSQYTHDGQRGLLPAWLQMKDGALLRRDNGELIPTPSEVEFFTQIGVPWTAPENRGPISRPAEALAGRERRRS